MRSGAYGIVFPFETFLGFFQYAAETSTSTETHRRNLCAVMLDRLFSACERRTQTRYRASTSMYSLTFCVRVMSPERHHWKPAVQAAAVMSRTTPVDGQLPASQPHPLPIYGAQF